MTAEPAAASGPPRRLLVLPLASGGLAWLSLPDRNLWPLGLVALGPLTLFAVRSRPGRALAGGWLGGLLLYLLAMPWVVDVMTQYGGLDKTTAVLVGLLLHAYLALYWGAYAWLLARLAATGAARALAVAPLLWAGLEWTRGWFLSGFPWIPLALSQWRTLPILQHAEWGGVYAVSAIVALPAVGLAALALPAARRVGIVEIAAFGALAAAGAWRLASWEARVASLPRDLPVGIVQAMVPLEERWDPAGRRQIEQRHAFMSAEAVKAGARALVWSESSLTVPGGFYGSVEARRRMGDLARELGVPVLFGGTSREPSAAGDDLVYNSAFLVGATGSLEGRYDKVHLVPFGEYVPMEKALFFAKKLVREVGTFGRGEGPVLVPLGPARAGAPICYEIIFPEIGRAFVRAGAELIVTITNDAWFGRTAAPEQHFAHAAFRAVETRRFVIRCANTGISGVVAPTGRVESHTPVFERALLVGRVARLSGLTPYARAGDVLPILGVMLAALAALPSRGRTPAEPRPV